MGCPCWIACLVRPQPALACPSDALPSSFISLFPPQPSALALLSALHCLMLTAISFAPPGLALIHGSLRRPPHQLPNTGCLATLLPSYLTAHATRQTAPSKGVAGFEPASSLQRGRLNQSAKHQCASSVRARARRLGWGLGQNAPRHTTSQASQSDKCECAAVARTLRSASTGKGRGLLGGWQKRCGPAWFFEGLTPTWTSGAPAAASWRSRAA